MAIQLIQTPTDNSCHSAKFQSEEGVGGQVDTFTQKTTFMSHLKPSPLTVKPVIFET